MTGARVLDAFCFSGGFGIAAIKQGRASSVVAIDSSESALAMAAANAELNGVAAQCEYIRRDVRKELEAMAEQGTMFDVVILDPPKMARTRGGVSRALKGYQRINAAALRVLKPGGILVTCSCSGLVSRDEFCEMIGEVSRISNRPIRFWNSMGSPQIIQFQPRVRKPSI